MTTESLPTWHRINSILGETLSFGVNKTMRILYLLKESESILEFKEIFKVNYIFWVVRNNALIELQNLVNIN